MNNKLELLTRRSKGKNEVGALAETLSSILGVPIASNEFIDLIETDRLTNVYYKVYQKFSESNRVRYQESNLSMLISDLNLLLSKLEIKEAYLLLKQTHFCGTIKVSFQNSIVHFKDLIKLDGDSLCLLSVDESNGLHLDYFEEYVDSTSTYFYELTTW